MSKYAKFFVSAEIVEREVLLGDGATHKVSFRKVSSFDWGRFIQHLRSTSADERAGAQPLLIAASLCEPDGAAAMSLEEAQTLDPAVSDALFEQAYGVCKPTKREPGNA